MNTADSAQAYLNARRPVPIPVGRRASVKQLEQQVADLDFQLECSIDREREADASVRELTTALDASEADRDWWRDTAAWGWVAAGMFFGLFVTVVLVG